MGKQAAVCSSQFCGKGLWHWQGSLFSCVWLSLMQCNVINSHSSRLLASYCQNGIPVAVTFVKDLSKFTCANGVHVRCKLWRPLILSPNCCCSNFWPASIRVSLSHFPMFRDFSSSLLNPNSSSQGSGCDCCETCASTLYRSELWLQSVSFPVLLFLLFPSLRQAALWSCGRFLPNVNKRNVHQSFYFRMARMEQLYTCSCVFTCHRLQVIQVGGGWCGWFSKVSGGWCGWLMQVACTCRGGGGLRWIWLGVL